MEMLGEPGTQIKKRRFRWYGIREEYACEEITLNNIIW